MITPLTVREIQAMFDKGRRVDNEVSDLLLNEAPTFFVEHPEWLDSPCCAASICELQIALLLRAEADGSMDDLLFRSSPRLRELFAARLSQSVTRGAAFVDGARCARRDRLHGDTIQKLDQKICEYREMGIEAEQALFAAKSASPRVIEWLGRGELTFRRVLERSPHLLLLRWYSILGVL